MFAGTVSGARAVPDAFPRRCSVPGESAGLFAGGCRGIVSGGICAAPAVGSGETEAEAGRDVIVME